MTPPTCNILVLRIPDTADLGIWVALAPVLMLFLAFVSAYVVRQGLGSNWSAIPVPKLLWGNTLVLLISSIFLERARHLVRTDDSAARCGAACQSARQ